MMKTKIVIIVQQICEKNVWQNEKKKNQLRVEIRRQMSEKIVKTVQKMYENVQRIVEMEKQKKQKIVGIVRKMYENVVQRVEIGLQRNERIVRIVKKT